jgi:hypothetical protein
MRIPGTTFSDNNPLEDKRRVDGKLLYDFILRTAVITQQDLDMNHSEDLLFKNTVEELGEYAAAKTVENGIKKKKLKESSLIEAVDLVICSLSLFFANGGKIDDLHKIGQEKLNKWEERVKPMVQK